MYKVLLVDDESHFRFAAKMVLKRAGFDIKDAYNGESALNILVQSQKDNTPFDLLIMDIVMPGMSGIGLLEAMSKANIELPILVVSGISDREMIRELHNKGCSNILFKPFEPRQLIERVNKILAACNHVNFA